MANQYFRYLKKPELFSPRKLKKHKKKSCSPWLRQQRPKLCKQNTSEQGTLATHSEPLPRLPERRAPAFHLLLFWTLQKSGLNEKSKPTLSITAAGGGSQAVSSRRPALPARQTALQRQRKPSRTAAPGQKATQ